MIVNGVHVETVASFLFLVTFIADEFVWDANTSALVKKVQQMKEKKLQRAITEPVLMY